MSKGKVGGLTVIGVIILCILAIPVVIWFYENSHIFRPNTVVVSTRSEEVFNPGEYGRSVIAVVRNDGASGEVTVQAILYTEGKSWQHSQRVYIGKGDEKYEFCSMNQSCGMENGHILRGWNEEEMRAIFCKNCRTSGD